MATKVVKWLNCSSIVLCRRYILSSAQQTNTITNNCNFNWIGGKTKQIPSYSYISTIRSMASSSTNINSDVSKAVEAETTSTPEGNELGKGSNTTVEPVILEIPKEREESVKIEEPLSSSSSSTVPAPDAAADADQNMQKVRRNKAAILLCYSGQGYFGMQMQNNGTRTIENDLMKAFYDAGVVDKEGFEKPKSMKFQRAARTDKNVSAARNIISMMVPKTFDVDVVNKLLPDQIRVMDFRRVTKGFDAKIACCARTYLYMIPTFAFTPLEESVTESYRISPEVLENLRKTLKMYEGTKNYHNFTSRKKPTDPSAIRFIMSFTSSEPFVKEGLEYVVLQVKGQSFMLHQIRKMIGLAVAILRGCANEETMKKAFTLNRIDIPMAPGLGLMLGEAHYDHYNKKFGRDGIHEPLLWDNVADKIEAFCQEKIYTEVTRTENEEKSMFQWLATVPLHTFDIREGDEKGKGYGPLGHAQLLVKKENGEDSDNDLDDDEDADDLPRKKQRVI